jgi:hypothetical protein
MNQETIEQYVAGRLPEAQAAAFEDYCVLNPEFARQVEFEQRLKLGVAVATRDSPAEFVRPNHPLRRNLAAAAGVLLAVFGLFYAWTHMAPAVARPIMAAITTDAERSGASLRLAMVRGLETTPTMQDRPVRVEIVGLFDLGASYSVALKRLDEDGKVATVATLESLHPTSPVTLEVMIDGHQLRRGTYSLQARGQAPDEESLDFGFKKF